MMYELVVQLAQIMALTGIAAWLATGVYDNLVYPENNETFTAQVLSMERMREDYPEHFARVSHRAIQNRATQRLAFWFVVLAEAATCLVLICGVVALIFAMIGVFSMDTAAALALLGATLFAGLWTGFLVVGNYFCYWFSHEGAQNTHYQMTLWGLGVMIFLAVTL